MECCYLLKALTVIIVYSLKFQNSLEALKWDYWVYKNSAKMLLRSLFQRLFLSLIDVFLL